MPLTAAGTFYRHLAGSPKLGADQTSRSGEEELMLSWGSIDSFISESLPPPLVIGGFVLHAPRRTMPGYPYLFTESIRIEPWDSSVPGGCDDIPSSQWAKASVSYKTIENEDEDEQDPETFLTHRISIGAEFLTLPKQAARWHGEEGEEDAEIPKGEDIPFSKLIPTAEHQFTWKQVVSPPFTAIRNAIGKTNSVPIFGAATETLLFLGVDAQREFTSDGQKPWTLDYRFSERLVKDGGIRVIGWNHAFRPESGKWEVPKLDGKKIYDQTGFLTLFQPG